MVVTSKPYYIWKNSPSPRGPRTFLPSRTTHKPRAFSPTGLVLYYRNFVHYPQDLALDPKAFCNSCSSHCSLTDLRNSSFGYSLSMSASIFTAPVVGSGYVGLQLKQSKLFPVKDSAGWRQRTVSNGSKAYCMKVMLAQIIKWSKALLGLHWSSCHLTISFLFLQFNCLCFIP